MATTKIEAASSKKRVRDEFFEESSAKVPSIFGLADAAAHITKKLLALGSENNWDDVIHNHGRTLSSALYRQNWLYLSRKDHGDREESTEKKRIGWLEDLEENGNSQHFFYHIPQYEEQTHKNRIARIAASSVLSLSGSCDQHAYVLAILLQAILPKGTHIHICGLIPKNSYTKPFPHTFVVIGRLPHKKLIPLTSLDSSSVIVADAWPIIGGAVKIMDFFVCSGDVPSLNLKIDQSFIADGEDHLIKRIAKQKILYDILNRQKATDEYSPIKTRTSVTSSRLKEPDAAASSLEISSSETDDTSVDEEAGISISKSKSLIGFLHHEVDEQQTYTSQIKRTRCVDPKEHENMFSTETISDTYTPPEDSKFAYEYILKNYPSDLFQRCLCYVHEQTETIVKSDPAKDADFSERLYSNPYK